MKYALITGASSGIGLELAKVFAEHKHNLILVARSVDKLEKLKSELESKYQIKAEVIPADLSVSGASQKLYETVQKRNLAVDILVNNAGFGDYGSFIDSELGKQEEMIQVNITALTALTKLFLPAMIAGKSGKIMNVASTAAFQPGPLMTVYYATKAYVLFFSEGLTEELKNTGVTVTALCPGPTSSNFQSAANIKDVPFMTQMKIPTSQDVAIYAYKALMCGTPVAVHGTFNKFGTMSVRMVPRSWARKLVMKLQEKRH